MRPPTAKLTFEMSCSDRKEPDTRSDSVSSPVSMVPPGRTTFCACSARISAERSMPSVGQLLHGELDEDPFVLRAEDLDLGDVRHMEQLRAHVFHVVSKLAEGEAIGREAVDDAERVAELVVEAGSDYARRERMAHVADAFAHVVPDVRYLSRRRAALEIDEDRRDAGARVAAQEVELRRLLQRPLEPLRDLLQRVVDRGPGPRGLDDHRLDDEGRVLVPPEPVVRQTAPQRPRRS